MKSTMAKELITSYSEKGDVILDPFSGSGTVPLETIINGRSSIAIDRNPYSLTLTRAKLNPPESVDEAIKKAEGYLKQIDPKEGMAIEETPEWVKKFYHPKTLSGLEQLFPLLLKNDENFIISCLLGILHHQRPGFLSYPASHLKPYLRDEKFPRDEYPERYEYREINQRLISKIERAYRRFPEIVDSVNSRVEAGEATEIMADEIQENEVDRIITSPPYMDKLDYGRDNRLRLYFLGLENHKQLDSPPESKEAYAGFFDDFLSNSNDILTENGRMVFVLGESKRSGSAVDTSEIVLEKVSEYSDVFSVEAAIQDKVPVREINSMSSKNETIIVLDKD
jgi:methylase of polypeptide subunit release factors